MPSETKKSVSLDGLTFDAFIDDWLDIQCSQLKESSRIKYRNIIRKHLIPRFGGRSPADIRRDDLLAFSRALLDCGLSARSITSILSVARSILRYTQECGVPAEDPGPIPLKQNARAPRVFSRSEQERLTAFLCRQDDLGSRGIRCFLIMFRGLC